MKFEHIIPEEVQHVQQPKHCVYDNKDEDNSLNNVNNKNVQYLSCHLLRRKKMYTSSFICLGFIKTPKTTPKTTKIA